MTDHPTREDWRIFERAKRLTFANKEKALKYLNKLISRQSTEDKPNVPENPRVL